MVNVTLILKPLFLCLVNYRGWNTSIVFSGSFIFSMASMVNQKSTRGFWETFCFSDQKNT